MGDKKIIIATQLGKGSYVILDGAACRVSDVSISKPGKHGHAKVRVEAMGLLDEKKRQVVMPGHENVEVPIIEKRNAQVLSVSGDMANVMDSDSFEVFDLKVPAELAPEIQSGVQVMYWDIMGEKVIKQVRKE